MGSFFDNLINWAVDLVLPLLLLLPESPIQAWQPVGFSQFALILGWVNYFVPLGAMAGIMSGYLVAVLIWYGVRWFLRIVRYIE